MTIKKAEEWGSDGFVPHDLVVALDEESLARAVAHGSRHVSLQAGDLLSALGSSIDVRELRLGERCRLLPFDAYEVTVSRRGNSETTVAASTVLVGSALRPAWWFTAGGFVGRFNSIPNSHPNDGRADALEWSRTTLRERLAIHRRMRLGDHLPHPALRTVRGETITWQSDRGSLPVTIDGRSWGRADEVRITVRPDAFVLFMPN